MIEYVLKQTDMQNLSQVGHSQGCGQMQMAIDDFGPSFYNKINLFVNLAPAIIMKNQSSMLLTTLSQIRTAGLMGLLGFKDFVPNNAFWRLVSPIFCKICPTCCKDLIFLVCGKNDDPMHNLNSKRMPLQVYNTPSGTSVKNMRHWTQWIRDGKPTKFDYGLVENKKKYGQIMPPVWKVKRDGPPTVIL